MIAARGRTHGVSGARRLIECRRVTERAALSEQVATRAANGESEREHEADDAHGAADVGSLLRIRQHRRWTRDGLSDGSDPLIVGFAFEPRVRAFGVLVGGGGGGM